MDPILLSTKLQIPPQPPDLVRRTRLIDALRRKIPHYELVLLSAPAGYGKTTLLAQWGHASRLPVAWLSLGKDDNEIERFFRYLLTAWETVQPDVLESPLGILLGARAPDSEAVLSAFVNQANELREHTVFVLDDYHLIKDEAIHQALTFLLDHLPPKCHFALAGRREPPLPLARYRARRMLLEFRAEELSFGPQETRDFLQQRMKSGELDPEEIEAVHRQLEGWIAGLQLMTLARQGRRERLGPAAVSGSQRFIADYLSEDVLAQLSEPVRRFLLQTSVAERLCGPLCNALTGREDGQEMLETAERQNLFLVPLDDNREWFRYHRLFAGFLREELKRRHPDEVAALHRRAGRWHLEQGLPDQAFDHALAGDDVELVNQVFERYWPVKLLGGEIRVVKQWLDSLPEEWQSGYPMIGFARAGTLLVTGQFEACARCLDEVEQWLAPVESADRPAQRARLTALRCFIACFQDDLARAETLADQALRGLPEEEVDLRTGVYGALGDTYRRNARWQEAQECYLQALDLDHARTFQVLSAHIFGALADLCLRQGCLRDAAGYWRQALAAIQKRENWGRLLPLPVIGWIYIRLGELLYEWNNLAEAWDHLSQGLERAELGGDVRALIAGYLLAGRLKLTEGDSEAAEEYLERARPHVESAQFVQWTSRFERLQLELWLAQDRLRAAVNWADTMLSDATIEERPESEVAQLALARVLIVKGDSVSIEEALSRLEQVLRAAAEEGRAPIQIEGLALQALAQWRRGERANALTALEHALRLAEPEGYVRRFVDYGLPLARLLQEARNRAVMPDYVEKLLAAYEIDLTSLAPAEPALPEPLTPREQEVLELLAAGLTNREIGEELIISPKTVKKHASNIYSKLDVHSRTEAAARARELDLLD